MTSRYVVEFSPPSPPPPKGDLRQAGGALDWQAAGLFETQQRAAAEALIRARVGDDRLIEAGRLVDRIRDEVCLVVTRADLSHTVHCYDDRSKRRHFSDVASASAYANALLAAGLRARIFPYRPPRGYTDFLISQEG